MSLISFPKSSRTAGHERLPVEIYEDSDQACQVIAEDIITKAKHANKTKPLVLGLATGSTPIKFISIWSRLMMKGV